MTLMQFIPATLWAAHKTVIRGKIIQLFSLLKREHRAAIDKLTKEFHAKIKHKCDPIQVSRNKLETARLSLNLALTTEAEKCLRWSDARFYSRLARSWQPNCPPKPRSLAFPKISTPSGTLTQNH